MKVLTTEVTPISGRTSRLQFRQRHVRRGQRLRHVRDGRARRRGGHRRRRGSVLHDERRVDGGLPAPDRRPAHPSRRRGRHADALHLRPAIDLERLAHRAVSGEPRPTARVTVGGTVSITDVVPGEGVWPAVRS